LFGNPKKGRSVGSRVKVLIDKDASGATFPNEDLAISFGQPEPSDEGTTASPLFPLPAPTREGVSSHAPLGKFSQNNRNLFSFGVRNEKRAILLGHHNSNLSTLDSFDFVSFNFDRM